MSAVPEPLKKHGPDSSRMRSVRAVSAGAGRLRQPPGTRGGLLLRRVAVVGRRRIAAGRRRVGRSSIAVGRSGAIRRRGIVRRRRGGRSGGGLGAGGIILRTRRQQQCRSKRAKSNFGIHRSVPRCLLREPGRRKLSERFFLSFRESFTGRASGFYRVTV